MTVGIGRDGRGHAGRSGVKPPRFAQSAESHEADAGRGRVVYGDIGTSPLYAVKETFVGHHKLVVDQLHIFGVISLMFWSLMMIVTLKYIIIIMRADNNGEGGSLALLALIQRRSGAGKRWGPSLVILGVLATALFFGDCMITRRSRCCPRSRGWQRSSRGSTDWVLPLAIGILVGLFWLQSVGTTKVSVGCSGRSCSSISSRSRSSAWPRSSCSQISCRRSTRSGRCDSR